MYCRKPVFDFNFCDATGNFFQGETNLNSPDYFPSDPFLHVSRLSATTVKKNQKDCCHQKYLQSFRRYLPCSFLLLCRARQIQHWDRLRRVRNDHIWLSCRRCSVLHRPLLFSLNLFSASLFPRLRSGMVLHRHFCGKPFWWYHCVCWPGNIEYFVIIPFRHIFYQERNKLFANNNFGEANNFIGQNVAFSTVSTNLAHFNSSEGEGISALLHAAPWIKKYFPVEFMEVNPLLCKIPDSLWCKAHAIQDKRQNFRSRPQFRARSKSSKTPISFWNNLCLAVLTNSIFFSPGCPPIIIKFRI